VRLWIASLSLLVATSAGAAEKARAKQELMKVVSKAKAAFDESRFEEAAHLYIEALRVAEREQLGGRAALSFNAGVAFQQAGTCDRAAELFDQFRSLDAASAQKAEVKGRIEAADRCAPMVDITSEPPGASVQLDGRAVGKTPLEMRVRAGPHRIAMDLLGYAHYEEQIDIGTKEIVVSLSPAGVSPPPVATTPPGEPRESSAPAPVPEAPRVATTVRASPESGGGPGIWPWITGGVAVGAGVAAIVFRQNALSAREDANALSNCVEPNCAEYHERAASSKDREALAWGAGIVAGVAALATAAIIFFVDGDPGVAAVRAEGAALAIDF
jgi:hypothetical protein